MRSNYGIFLSLGVLVMVMILGFSQPGSAPTAAGAPEPTSTAPAAERDPANAQIVQRDPSTPEETGDWPGWIGPTMKLPGGWTYGYIGNLDQIGKSGGLNITFSSMHPDKYTALYWGPSSSNAIQLALQGPLTPERILVFDLPSSILADGIGVWKGSSPNFNSSADLPTRFTVHITNPDSEANIPLVDAASLGITGADVVIAAPANFRMNLLFETGSSSSDQFTPTHDLFNSIPEKAPELDQSILSSFDAAFWYKAPNTGIELSMVQGQYCLESTIQFLITITNYGPGQVTQVVVKAPLPAGMSFISASDPVYEPASGTWAVGTLADGQSLTLTITASVTLREKLAFGVTRTQYQFDPVKSNDAASLVRTCSWIPSVIR